MTVRWSTAPSAPASSCSASARSTSGGCAAWISARSRSTWSLRALDELDLLRAALGLCVRSLTRGLRATSSSSRRASSIRLASSFSAIARSFSTAMRAALEGRLVGALLDRLARRLAQRLLDLGARRDVGHADRDERDPELLEGGLGAQAALDPLADRRHARVQDRAHVELAELVDDELLGELAEQAGDLLERGLRPAARREVEREVHAPGERGRVGDAEGDHALDRELLEVRAAHAEQERQLAVVDRDLGDGGVDRAEPERQPGAVAAQVTPAIAEDVVGRLAAEVAEERISLDGGHAEILL